MQPFRSRVTQHKLTLSKGQTECMISLPQLVKESVTVDGDREDVVRYLKYHSGYTGTGYIGSGHHWVVEMTVMMMMMMMFLLHLKVLFVF